MNWSSSIKRKTGVLARRYQAKLRRHLLQGPTAGWQPALRLGRQAVALGLETLDLALIHEQALMAQVLPIATPTARARVVKRAKTFFAEAILPLEETHRAAQEANVHLNRLNRALNRRTQALASSNRQLKREIVRRRAIEDTLKQSERRSLHLLGQSRYMQDQLRLLSRGVLSAQEEERKRISRELHDVIGQVLTTINARLASLKKEATVNTKGLTQSIAHTQRLVEKSVNIVRRFAYDLRPALLDDLGLVPCLESFMTHFMKETGIPVRLTAFAGVEQLNNAQRTVLYRVAHDALTNIARHAHASRGDVIIERRANDVYLRIKDNGKAFDVERVLRSKRVRRLGLLGMRERVEMVGGKFTVASAPGKGTTIQAQIPFRNGAKERTHP